MRISVRSLIDTNVLVYADASDAPTKQRIALNCIKEYRFQGQAVLSTQVLQEFVNVALRKLHLPMRQIKERLAFYQRFEVVNTSPEMIVGALDLCVLHSLSFYDALIVQAAMVSGCQQILSEDMQHGARFGAVQIVNPFANSPY